MVKSAGHAKLLVSSHYALFLGYEWILAGYYGKTIDIAKLTFAEIAQIRKTIEEEIIALTSLEDETSFVDAPDVTVEPDLV